MRSPRTHLALVAASLVGAASACRPAQRPGETRPNAPAVVIFENQSLYQAAVYAITSGGLGVRVGTVQPGHTDTLALRGGLVDTGGGVTIVARLLARRGTPSTGTLLLRPGDRIAVTLPSTANILTVLPAGG